MRKLFDVTCTYIDEDGQEEECSQLIAASGPVGAMAGLMYVYIPCNIKTITELRCSERIPTPPPADFVVDRWEMT